MSKLPTSLLTRPRAAGLLPSTTPSTTSSTASSLRRTAGNQQPLQVRHATFVERPRRPYEFTQLVQLSDGSTFTVRTTMPQALLKVTKDTRNHALWQPNDKSLRNVEVDEAGKLAAFRDRFGRSWDQEKKKTEEEEEEEAAKAEVAADKGDQAKKVGKDGEPAGKMADKKAAVPVVEEAVEEAVEEDDGYDSLVDLISGYASGTQDGTAGGMTAKELEKKEKAELAAKVAARKAGKAK